MAQISLNKIVSLHLQKCSGFCPNASVCYHMKKVQNSNAVINSDNIRREILKFYKVYESVCSFNSIYHKKILREFPNYNITVSSSLISPRDEDLFIHRDQIQVSVYSANDIINFEKYQKLFLIKDEESVYSAYNFMKQKTGKLHFIIDQEFLSSKGGNPSRRVVNFMMAFEKRVDYLQSADTCLTSWVINGKCPYSSQNYVDLNYDSTIRKCPYIKEPIALINTNIKYLVKNISSVMSSNKSNHECIYEKLFKGDMDGRIIKDSNLQNSSSNSGNGSSTKRMRRLSLRN